MDDLVTRLVRELPDTAKDRYDVAFERGRAQARSSLLFTGLGLGFAAGAAAMYLLDPRLGRGRRADLGQRVNGLLNDLNRTAEGRGKDLRNRAVGAATELGLPGTPPSNAERREQATRDPDSGTLVAPRSAAAPTPASWTEESLDRDESPVLAGTQR